MYMMHLQDMAKLEEYILIWIEKLDMLKDMHLFNIKIKIKLLPQSEI